MCLTDYTKQLLGLENIFDLFFMTILQLAKSNVVFLIKKIHA